MYYLIAKNNESELKEEVLVELSNRKNGVYLDFLSNIDEKTTKFKSEKELVDRLYDRKYITFKNASLYILNEDKDENRVRKVIYNNCCFIPNMRRSENVIDNTTKRFETLFNRILTLLKNISFIEFIDNKEVYDPNLKELIQIMEEYGILFNSPLISKMKKDIMILQLTDKIKNKISDYELFRELYIMFLEYITEPKKTDEDLQEYEKEEFLTNDDFKDKYDTKSLYYKKHVLDSKRHIIS